MADGFTFELVSPENLVLSGEASLVTVPGREGDLGIMANHAPLMTSLRPGLIDVDMTDGKSESFFVRGGFADISPAGVTVLAEFALPRADMTREIFEEQRRIAQEDYDAAHQADDDEKKANAASFLDQLNHLEPTLMPG